MITAFSRRIDFLIPCTSRIPILDGKFSSKSAAYTRANTVFGKPLFLRNPENHVVVVIGICESFLVHLQVQMTVS
jgi:hypothetical protein